MFKSEMVVEKFRIMRDHDVIAVFLASERLPLKVQEMCLQERIQIR
jgi:hypothetical protein